MTTYYVLGIMSVNTEVSVGLIEINSDFELCI